MTIHARIGLTGQPPVQIAIDDKKHPNAGFAVLAAVMALGDSEACPIRAALYAATDDIPETKQDDKSRGNKNTPRR